jgi:hypothetical protein
MICDSDEESEKSDNRHMLIESLTTIKAVTVGKLYTRAEDFPTFSFLAFAQPPPHCAENFFIAVYKLKAGLKTFAFAF